MLKQDAPLRKGHPLLWYIQAQASRITGRFFVEDDVVGNHGVRQMLFLWKWGK
jgi:hypothetical protein